ALWRARRGGGPCGGLAGVAGPVGPLVGGSEVVLLQQVQGRGRDRDKAATARLRRWAVLSPARHVTAPEARQPRTSPTPSLRKCSSDSPTTSALEMDLLVAGVWGRVPDNIPPGVADLRSAHRHGNALPHHPSRGFGTASRPASRDFGTASPTEP